MSFWDLSDGGSATDTGTEYEIPGGGDLTPIPNGSSVLAMIDEAKWDERNDARYISLRWSVLSPDEYKNRKIFQKLFVTDADPNAKSADAAMKKRDKARRMLAAIDANAGHKLVKVQGEPNDDQLQLALCNKPMLIKCMVWSMDDREKPGEKIEGNWIAAVSPKAKGIDVKPVAPKPAKSPKAEQPPMDEMDDDVPF